MSVYDVGSAAYARHYAPAPLGLAASALADIVALGAAAGLVALATGSTGAGADGFAPGFLLAGAFASALFLLIVWTQRGSAAGFHPFQRLRWIAIAASAGLLVHGSLAFALASEGGRAALMLFWILGPLTILFVQGALASVCGSLGLPLQSMVIVGSGATVRRALELFERRRPPGIELLDVIALPERAMRAETAGDGPLVAALRILRGQYPRDTVFLAGHDGLTVGEIKALKGFASAEHARIAVLAPDGSGLEGGGARGTSFLTVECIGLEPPRLAPLAKRLCDVAGALAALVILSPLLAVLAALVKLDGGPVLFGHARVGRGGEPFRCLKFRTMIVDADQALARFLDDHPGARREWEETQKLRRDPRITRIGAFLRATSLDELPQLLNVLRGEMSLVGPRPIVASERARYGEKLAHYLQVRPGITGLWQVSGRSTTSYAARVAYDAWYVENWSIWLDLWIMLRTLPEVMLRRGAY